MKHKISTKKILVFYNIGLILLSGIILIYTVFFLYANFYKPAIISQELISLHSEVAGEAINSNKLDEVISDYEAKLNKKSVLFKINF